MTLNDAAKYTKRFVAYFVLFLILYVVGENLIKGSTIIYESFFPTPQDPPNVIFGKIDKLNIQTLPIDLSVTEYRKSLPSIGFPTFPKFVRVYQIEALIKTPEKEEIFKRNAANLNFLGLARKASDSKRIWVNNLNREQYEAEVYLQTFKYFTDTNYLESKLEPGNTVTSSEAVDATKDFFTKYSTLGEEIQDIELTTNGVLIKEGLIKETLLPDKEIIKFVNVVPKKIGYITSTYNKVTRKTDEIPHYFNILGINPKISNINAYVGRNIESASSEEKVYLANYLYFKPTPSFGIYPIINVSDAWKILTSNRASLVYIKEDGADFFAPSESITGIKTIDITEVQLAYYMDSKYMNYLQPVYVFSGKFVTTDYKKGDVYFYLPAIDDQLLIN